MSIERDKDFEQLEDIAAMMTENSGIEFEDGKYVYYGLDTRTAFAAVYISGAWSAWQAAKAEAVPKNKQFNLDEFLVMEEKLKSKGGVIAADLDRFIAYAEMVLEKAKAQAVPDTYTPIVLALEDVQSKIEKASFLTMDAENESEVYAVDASEISAYIDELIEAQEPK